MYDSKKYAEWNKILDELFLRAQELKDQKKSIEPIPSVMVPYNADNHFDFEKMVFERLKPKVIDSRITLREYYRLMGAWFSLKKVQSRQVLLFLVTRFNLKTNNRHIWFEGGVDG